jgi:hypothetical protein
VTGWTNWSATASLLVGSNSVRARAVDAFGLNSTSAPVTINFICTYTFTTNNAAITITGYTGSGGAESIPDTINGLPVKMVGPSAFLNCATLISITVPNGVTNISTSAFQSCSNLTGIMLGTNLSIIGTNAFANCVKLTNVLIPNSVCNLGPNSFQNCTNLASVTIPDSVTNIGSGAFQSCAKLTAVTLGTNITSLGGFAFANCVKLTNIVIPDSVISLGSSAFQSCSNLADVSLGKGIASLGNSVFANCVCLTKVTLPKSISFIGSGAFQNCMGLTAIYFPSNAPTLGVPSSLTFSGANVAIIYYLPGTTGWSVFFGGRPTALWLPRMGGGSASFGILTNQFGFTVNWASGQTVIVDACSNLASPVWQPVQTNTLTGSGDYFSDPQWTNYIGRFYRLRSP